MVAANRNLKLAKPGSKRRIPQKRKGELIAPACRPDCEINHSVVQAAAIMQVSVWQVQQLVKLGKLAAINCGTGDIKKLLRMPHSAIRALLSKPNPS